MGQLMFRFWGTFLCGIVLVASALVVALGQERKGDPVLQAETQPATKKVLVVACNADFTKEQIQKAKDLGVRRISKTAGTSAVENENAHAEENLIGFLKANNITKYSKVGVEAQAPCGGPLGPKKHNCEKQCTDATLLPQDEGHKATALQILNAAPEGIGRTAKVMAVCEIEIPADTNVDSMPKIIKE